MMDETDCAQAYAECFRNAALAAHFRKIKEPSPKKPVAIRPASDPGAGPDGAGEGRICPDCGKPIPAARLAAMPGATRCTRCEAKREVDG